MTHDDGRARAQVRMPLGREGSRDHPECSGVTALGAADAPASCRRASAPGTLRHYLATRLEDVNRQPSAGMSERVILRRIHGEPRLCERGMDTDCSSAKCGRAPLPRTRTVCVAVTDPADGSLRWCILRPPRTWEAGRTSNPTRLRT